MFDHEILPFFQYMPLPLFFAEDKISFYKVMSDTNGYKHIHYVKDVSIIYLIYSKYTVAVIMSLVLSVVLTIEFLLRVKQHLLPLGNGKLSTYPN